MSLSQKHYYPAGTEKAALLLPSPPCFFFFFLFFFFDNENFPSLGLFFSLFIHATPLFKKMSFYLFIYLFLLTQKAIKRITKFYNFFFQIIF